MEDKNYTFTVLLSDNSKAYCNMTLNGFINLLKNEINNIK